LELIKMTHPKTISIASVNKYLRRVSSLFHWGKRHGYIHENPFNGLGLKEHRMAYLQRERFRYDELKKLFDPEHHSPEKFKHSYCYWLPWLGLYTGARLEELCQLHLPDIRQEGGIWVIDINGKDEKRMKTPAAERLVPIHSRLIELGLLERVSMLQSKGENRLFPELRQTRDGYGQAASKWFARHRTRFGINKQFHSLRHTFVDELRQKGSDHKKIAALVGHVDESETGGRYGKPFLPEVLQPVVEMLCFDI
jgi:integrase